VELVQDDPVIREHLGDVYRELGDRENARESYRRALELQQGDSSRVEEKIRDLDEGTP
jgi:Flp pilus assembly protein TadD